MQLETKQLVVAIKAIAEEKNLPEETVEEIVKQALAAAYRRDFGDRDQEIDVEINHKTGDVKMHVTKNIVDEVTMPEIEVSLPDAQVMRKNAKIGETVEIIEQPSHFGRVAAQTAKQVILQRLRESEREIVLAEYEDKIGTVLTGNVTRVEQRIVRVDVGKTQGILPMSEQIRGEHYHYGQRLKVYLKEVERSMRGPQLILSRSAPEFIKYLFSSEVPEMENGAVEIKEIAREAGVRTKLGVSSTVPGVDPVGTFVGGHGTRVQAVMSEIGDDEKIDIIQWDSDTIRFIKNALAPTEVTNVTLHEADHKATVQVPEAQLSIAIGKGGQNVRLASKLTGWEIDVVSDKTDAPAVAAVAADEPSKPRKKLASKAQLEESLLKTLESQNDK